MDAGDITATGRVQLLDGESGFITSAIPENFPSN
jgi:hypothetical protein